MSTRSRAAIAAAVAAASLAASGAVAAAHPQAPEAVIVGDSLPANPAITDYAVNKLTGAGTRSGCPGDGRFAAAYERGSGMRVADYTCAGASTRTGGMRVSDQVARAMEAGDLGPHTRQVAVMAGANDVHPRLLNERAPLDVILADLRGGLAAVVNQIHEASPDAEVKIIGLPTVSDEHGSVCLVNLGPGGVRTPGVDLSEIEPGVEAAQAAAAADTRARFVSIKSVTAGHGLCDADRWIVGVVDDRVPYNLTLHFTHHGSDEVGSFSGSS